MPVSDNLDAMFDESREQLVKVLREFPEGKREAEVALALEKAKEYDERRILLSKVNKMLTEDLREFVKSKTQ